MANNETPAKPNWHATYLKNSPSYAAYYERYGMNLPHRPAIQFAVQHDGLTLEELREQDGVTLKVTNGTVNLRELFEALGY